MGISGLDSSAVARTLKTTEDLGEHIPHHRDTYVEALIGNTIEPSVVLSPELEGSISQLLRGLWRQYKGFDTTRYSNLSSSDGLPVIVYKGGISLATNRLSMIAYSNLSTTTAYLMIWDEVAASANTIAAGKVPQYMFPMWGETGPVAIGADILSPGGRSFSFGVVWAISSTPTIYTALTSGNIFVEIYHL